MTADVKHTQFANLNTHESNEYILLAVVFEAKWKASCMKLLSSKMQQTLLEGL